MREFRPFGRKLTFLTSAGIVVVLVLYPLLVYLGISYLGTAWIAALLIAVCILRLCSFRFDTMRQLGPQILIVCCGGILLAAASLLLGTPDAMLYYPVLVNAAMFFVFAHSLVYPPTIVERLARLKDGDLPEEAVAYTRRVTVAWVVFFACNGGVALYTALLTPLELWTLYNGIVAYVLMGLMFCGELFTRARVKRKARA